MPLSNRVLTEYILHTGDTGEGEGVALIWLEPECPFTPKAKIELSPSGDLKIMEPDFHVTLARPAAECLNLMRTTGELHVIHQVAGQAPTAITLSFSA